MPDDGPATAFADDGRPAIAPPYRPVTVSADEIQFRAGPWAGPIVTVRDEDGDGSLGELPALLTGAHRLSTIIDRFPPAHQGPIKAAIGRLHAEGVVTDLTDSAAGRLDGYLAIDPTIDRPDRISASSVLVVGDGAMARMVAADLTHVSVDDVSLLPRHGDGSTDGGVSATVDRLPPDTALSEAIADVDVVAAAFERSDHTLGRRINAVTFAAGVPWISGRLAGLDGQVGPTIVPGRSACYECYYRRARGTVATDRPVTVDEASPATRAPLRAHARIIAGWLVIDLLRLLAGGTAVTLGGLVHFDFFDMTVEPNPVLKLPRCPTCGTDTRRSIDVKRFVDYDRLLEDDG